MEEKQKREEERAATQRRREEERVATQRRKEEERVAKPKRGVKRKAGPEQWDDGTSCPCGNDVGAGLTKNWAQCDTCEAWIHGGCYGLEWARDGP